MNIDKRALWPAQQQRLQLSGIVPVKAAVARLRLFVKRGLSIALQPVGQLFATRGLPGLFAYGDDAFDFDAYIAAHAAFQGSNPLSERSRCMSHTVKRRCVSKEDT